MKLRPHARARSLRASRSRAPSAPRYLSSSAGAIALAYLGGGVWLTAGCAAASVGAVVGARFLLGLAAGATTVVVPVYLGELAPNALSGLFGTASQLAMVFGILVADVLALAPLGDAKAFWLFAISAAVAALTVVAALALPLKRSPRYVIATKGSGMKLRPPLSAGT